MFKDYNMNQLILPLDLEVKLQENDIAFHIHHLVQSIPHEALEPFLRNEGCPAYHPRMMLKIILCAYTQSVFSGRKIEALLKDSIRMMWLAQGYEPSYRTINRFRVQPEVKELIRQCFVQFRCQLVEEKLIDQEAIFIDGTKIEANANKFTFVWKKSIEKYQKALIEKSNELYNELLEKEIIPEIERESEEQLSIEDLGQMAQKVDDIVTEYDKRIEASSDVVERKALRSVRKYPKQVRKKLHDYILRTQKYQRDFEIFGTRNSYSKTDHDATFMRMKDDYMKNGQLKAGYNVQIATEGQYALAFSLFPNPTDTRTLIPFLDEIEESYFELPKHIVADAGYGSEQNYNDILSVRKREALITYNMYLKEQKKKYKQNEFNPDNWQYDEVADAYTCPNQQRLVFKHPSVRLDKTGFKREFKIYECEDCSGCPFRSSCTKTKEGNNRKLMVNEKWEQQKEYVRAMLSEEKTSAIYRKRKIDVEPVFGFLKANLRFTRFSVRGKSKVENEMGLALMAVNLRKFTANS
ncbi:IS1182 family transposase [Mesobacillus foraminis]|uniref:IS1182 family transposase n=1 Tax=Mesobacillus foraminis TaxID=279826 RepID=UPI001BEBBB2F|nr:IS1182 family transposase [Mesobacillus foraminis]MBT2757815.1 IS1182 family transposase [Mesobacillus foraminis]